MLRRARLSCVVALALVACAGAGGTATAASFSILPGGGITATSLGRLTISAGAISVIECAAQLSGSMASGTAEKVVGITLGSITAASLSNCNVGVTTVLDTFPLRMSYVTITGTLPSDVASVRIRLETLAIELRGIPIIGDCLYAGSPEFDLTLDRVGTPGVYTTDLAWLRVSPVMGRMFGGVLCGSSVSLRGMLALTPPQTFIRF